LLLCAAQFAEAIPYLFGLAAMAFDGAFQRQGLEIMHVPWVHAESPEWYGAQFIGSILRRVLDNAVAGFNVMEQEIAIGMNDFASQSIRYAKNNFSCCFSSCLKWR
jgi:hypothetical protein